MSKMLGKTKHIFYSNILNKIKKRMARKISMKFIIILVALVSLISLIALGWSSSSIDHYKYTGRVSNTYVGKLRNSKVSLSFGPKSQGSITIPGKTVRMIYDCQSIIPVDSNNVPLKDQSCYTYTKKGNDIILSIIHDKKPMSIRLKKM